MERDLEEENQTEEESEGKKELEIPESTQSTGEKKALPSTSQNTPASRSENAVVVQKTTETTTQPILAQIYTSLKREQSITL